MLLHETGLRWQWRGARPPCMANKVITTVIPPARVRKDGYNGVAGSLTVTCLSTWDICMRIGGRGVVI
jgi:hypothetical protein